MNQPLSPEYLAALDDAIATMEEFLDEIRRYRSEFVPSLYGPLSYRYRVWLTDGTEHVPLDVVNDGQRTSTWVPKVGDPVGDGWRGEVVHWADPDDVHVMQVEEPQEIEEVVQMREIVESDSHTLEGLMYAMTTEDVDSLRSSLQAVQASMLALNDVAPAAAAGGEHSRNVEIYLDNNWRSDASRTFRQGVGELHDSFVALRAAIDDMVEADEALLLTLMAFVTAITEVLDIRREEGGEVISNMVSGGLSLLGVVLSPRDALAWVGLLMEVMGAAGEQDATDRRETMDTIQEQGFMDAVARANDSSIVSWPSFTNPGYDFA